MSGPSDTSESGSVIGVMHTGVTVSDMGRAQAFFRDILGAEVSESRVCDDPIFARITGVQGADIRIAFANLPGHQVELLKYVGPADRQTSNLRPCDTGHIHISLKVKGIEALVERMSAFDFVPSGPIQFVPARGMKVIYMYGFDSLIFELMEFVA